MNKSDQVAETIIKKLQKVKKEQVMPFEKLFDDYSKAYKSLIFSNDLFQDLVNQEQSEEVKTKIKQIQQFQIQNLKTQQEIAEIIIKTQQLQHEDQLYCQQKEIKFQDRLEEEDQLSQQFNEFVIKSEKDPQWIINKQPFVKLEYHNNGEAYLYKFDKERKGILKVQKNQNYNQIFYIPIFDTQEDQNSQETKKKYITTSVYNPEYNGKDMEDRFITSIDFDNSNKDFIFFTSKNDADKYELPTHRWNMIQNERDYNWNTVFVNSINPNEQKYLNNSGLNDYKNQEQNDQNDQNDSDSDFEPIIIKQNNMSIIQSLKNQCNAVIYLNQFGFLNVYQVENNTNISEKTEQSQNLILSTKLESQALCMSEDPNENFIYIGLKNGKIVKYGNFLESKNIAPENIYVDNQQAPNRITSLCINDNKENKNKSKNRFLAALSSDYPHIIKVIDLTSKEIYIYDGLSEKQKKNDENNNNNEQQQYVNSQEYNSFTFVNNNYLVIGTDYGQICKFYINEYQKTLLLQDVYNSTHKSAVIFTYFDSDTRTLYTGDKNGLILQWIEFE